MTEDAARLLLANLLDRMEADLAPFRGLISEGEREALRALIVADAQESALEPSDAAPAPVAPKAPPPKFVLNQKALTAQDADPSVVFCLDFGTAKSKAFAVKLSKDGNHEPIELGIGNLDEDIDGSLYTASSALWIDEEGRAFVGSEAIRQSYKARHDSERARVDSLKQFVSQAISSDELRHETLNSKEDPTGSGITQEETLLLYLGYLTDLATSELERLGHSRYSKRRFAMPCWTQDHRQWAAPYLADLVARAQLVADTFRGNWKAGIPIVDVLTVLRQTQPLGGQLQHLLALDTEASAAYSSRWGAVLEPIASASASTWTGFGARALMLVVDVGAGTTDVALFWLNRGMTPVRAFPVEGTERAVRMAGDHVDEILLKEILNRGHVDPRLRSRAESAIRLSGLRRLKEQLFTTGSVQHRLQLNDETVSLSLDEFSNLPDLQKFALALQGMVRDVISGLHPSWAQPAEKVALVLTGGGSSLPMVADLSNLHATLGQKNVTFVSATASPETLADLVGAALVPDYPKLAVAIGGCMGRVDERVSMKEFAGAAPRPGPLERFQTRGV